MSEKNRYYYAEVNRGVIEDERTSFESTWSKDHPEYLADDAAEQDFWNSGCESPEEMTLAIFEFDDEDSLLGVFDVTREYVPSFSSSEVCLACGGAKHQPHCPKCRKRYCECPAEDGTPYLKRPEFGEYGSDMAARKATPRCSSEFHATDAHDDATIRRLEAGR